MTKTLFLFHPNSIRLLRRLVKDESCIFGYLRCCRDGSRMNGKYRAAVYFVMRGHLAVSLGE